MLGKEDGSVLTRILSAYEPSKQMYLVGDSVSFIEVVSRTTVTRIVQHTGIDEAGTRPTRFLLMFLVEGTGYKQVL